MSTPREGISSPPKSRLIASGDGWTVSDIVCTAGPRDRPFEEGHTQTSIAIVVGGTFQYRSSTGRDLMTPGSWLLGNPGESFTCGHDHGIGDRCVAFSMCLISSNISPMTFGDKAFVSRCRACHRSARCLHWLRKLRPFWPGTIQVFVRSCACALQHERSRLRRVFSFPEPA